jgi:hypothetical protein
MKESICRQTSSATESHYWDVKLHVHRKYNIML